MSTKSKTTRKRRAGMRASQQQHGEVKTCEQLQQEEKDRREAAEAMSVFSSVIRLSDSAKLIPEVQSNQNSRNRDSTKTRLGNQSRRRQSQSNGVDNETSSLALQGSFDHVASIGGPQPPQEIVVNLNPKPQQTEIRLTPQLQQIILQKLIQSQQHWNSTSPVTCMSQPEQLASTSHVNNNIVLQNSAPKEIGGGKSDLLTSDLLLHHCSAAKIRDDADIPSLNLGAVTLSNTSVELSSAQVDQLFHSQPCVQRVVHASTVPGSPSLTKTQSFAPSTAAAVDTRMDNIQLESALPLKKRKLLSYQTEQTDSRTESPVIVEEAKSTGNNMERISQLASFSQTQGGRKSPASSTGNQVKINIDPRTSLILLNEMNVALNEDEDGDLPLHIAVAQENLKMVGKFVHLMTISGKTVDKYNKAQQTPLHIAVQLNFTQAVSLLLHAGANPNLVNRYGENSVHLAIKVRSMECLTLMTSTTVSSFKPDLNTRNFEGLAPLHTAVLMNNITMVTHLLEKGADVNILDGKSGRTPLFYAVENNNIRMAEILQDFNANMEMGNYAGVTPFMSAQARNLQDMARLLQKFDTKGLEIKDKEPNITKKGPLPRIPSKSHLIASHDVESKPSLRLHAQGSRFWSSSRDPKVNDVSTVKSESEDSQPGYESGMTSHDRPSDTNIVPISASDTLESADVVHLLELPSDCLDSKVGLPISQKDAHGRNYIQIPPENLLALLQLYQSNFQNQSTNHATGSVSSVVNNVSPSPASPHPASDTDGTESREEASTTTTVQLKDSTTSFSEAIRAANTTASAAAAAASATPASAASTHVGGGDLQSMSTSQLVNSLLNSMHTQHILTDSQGHSPANQSLASSRTSSAASLPKSPSPSPSLCSSSSVHSVTSSSGNGMPLNHEQNPSVVSGTIKREPSPNSLSDSISVGSANNEDTVQMKDVFPSAPQAPNHGSGDFSTMSENVLHKQFVPVEVKVEPDQDLSHGLQQDIGNSSKEKHKILSREVSRSMNVVSNDRQEISVSSDLGENIKVTGHPKDRVKATSISELVQRKSEISATAGKSHNGRGGGRKNGEKKLLSNSHRGNCVGSASEIHHLTTLSQSQTVSKLAAKLKAKSLEQSRSFDSAKSMDTSGEDGVYINVSLTSQTN